MRYLLFLLCSCVVHFVAFASEPLPSNVKQVCVLVRSAIGTWEEPAGTATGTGFFVAPDLVLTCNHLTQIPMGRGMVPVDNIGVETRKNHLVKARVVRRDTAHDLALLRVNEKLPGEPFRIEKFSMRNGDSVAIVGNFPEALRVTRGELLTRSVMEGFAMSSAKVRSGFSGGPILSADGTVQGILSQRDDDNNSIFVRSDIIIRLLKGFERKTGQSLMVLENKAKNAATAAAAAAAAEASKTSPDPKAVLPAGKTSGPSATPAEKQPQVLPDTASAASDHSNTATYHHRKPSRRRM